LGEGEMSREGASTPAGRKTLETVSAADAIVEALDLAASEEERYAEFEAVEKHRKVQGAAAIQVPLANPLMLGLSPADYVLRSVTQVRSSELEQALLMVPFTDSLRLLGYLSIWLERGSKVELLGRVATLLLRLHIQQLMATPSARAVLVKLQEMLRGSVSRLKDTMGFNLAAMEHLQRSEKEKNMVPVADGALTAALLPLKRKLDQQAQV